MALKTLSLQRVIISGGVGQLPHLLPRVRQRIRTLINGYIKSHAILENI
ncbi:MAG: hypothetical protein L0Z73_17205 [Gammaproteobacteria bacterium]|nr:hypothetical protein [Gammaproteobacteria bacterium]